MTTETRPRSTSDGDRDENYGGRNDRGYGAYTHGANALRLDSIFSAEDFDPPQWTPHARSSRESGAARLTTVDRSAAGAPRAGTSAPATPRRSGTGTRRVNAAPAATPRSGRSRKTPWLTDVTRETPVVTPASTSPVSAPALPLPRAPFVVLMIVLVVVGVVGVLVLNTKINEDSFRLADLRANQASLDLQEQQLRQQLADLESPNNLLAAATRLGLVPAGDPAFISLPDGSVVGLPQPASGR